MLDFPILILIPGQTRPLTLMVRATTTMEACVGAGVRHAGLPPVDVTGHPLTYALHPASPDAPLLPMQQTVRDLHLAPHTRLWLQAHTEPTSLRLHRRSVLVGGFLTLCALGGVSLGAATGLAQHLHNPARVALSLLPPASTATSTPLPVEALTPVLHFTAHQQTVRTVAWSPDGKLLASGGDDGQVFLWHIQGAVSQRLAHPAPVQALAWSPESQRLVTAAAKQVQFFAAASGTLLAPPVQAHQAPVTSLAWAQVAEQPVISGAQDRRAIVWDTAQYQPRAVFAGHTTAIEALCVLPQSTIVASASQGGAVRLWQAETVQELHADYEATTVPLHAIAFAPTMPWLIVGGDDGHVRLWSHALACQQIVQRNGARHCTDAPLEVEVHNTPIRTLAWSPDGRFLATGGDNGLLAVWTLSLQKGLTLLASARQSEPVHSLCWSPDQRFLAAASGTTVTLWKTYLA